MTEAQSNVSRARLDILKNELLSRVQAEKNSLALEEAVARLEQLRQTFTLKRQSEAAEVRTLEIQRDRAARALARAGTTPR